MFTFDQVVVMRWRTGQATIIQDNTNNLFLPPGLARTAEESGCWGPVAGVVRCGEARPGLSLSLSSQQISPRAPSLLSSSPVIKPPLLPSDLFLSDSEKKHPRWHPVTEWSPGAGMRMCSSRIQNFGLIFHWMSAPILSSLLFCG